MAEWILLLIGAAGVAFFLWSPSWLGPSEDEPRSEETERSR